MAKKIFSIFILSLILTAGWFVSPSQIEDVPLCLSRLLFSIDCPGCGLTRSFLELSRGHFADAVRFNPAGPLIYLLFVAYFIENLARLKKPGFALSIPPRTAVLYSVCVAVLLFGNWSIKLLMHTLGVI